MDFERYRNSIINDFIKNYKNCKILSRELTEQEINYIKEQFENHRNCYNNYYEEYCNDNMELFESCVYGNNISASIECNCCNNVIIDDLVINENNDKEELVDYYYI